MDTHEPSFGYDGGMFFDERRKPMETKFKKGSSWRARAGHEAVVVRLDPHRITAFHYKEISLGTLLYHDIHGIAFPSSYSPKFDLISPWVDLWEGEVLILKMHKNEPFSILSDQEAQYVRSGYQVIARVKVKEGDGMSDEKTLREIAEETVLRIRGSNDAPGFDLCVEAEIERLRKEGLMS